jgi:hypothetical protein
MSFLLRHGTSPPARVQPDYLKLHPIHVHPFFDPDGHQEGRLVDDLKNSSVGHPQVSTTYLLPILSIHIQTQCPLAAVTPGSYTCHAVGTLWHILADIRGYINLSPPCTISMYSYSLRPDKVLLDIYITKSKS